MPSTQELYDEVQLLCNEQDTSIGVVNNILPDRDFLVRCLSTLNPQHRFFQPNYMAPKKPKKKKPKQKLHGYSEFFRDVAVDKDKKYKRSSYTQLLKIQSTYMNQR